MNRRKFLKHATRTSLLPAMLHGTGLAAFAKSPLYRSLYQSAEDTDRVLVLIYLGGGNDGLNTVVPMDQYAKLNAARPTVILPESSLLSLSGVNNNKLHPSLTGFRNLYDDGRLGIIQNVGYPDQNYSHFRSTDIWMTAADSDEVLPTGWLGRYLNTEYPNFPVDYPNEDVPDPLAIEIGYNLSVAFQGPVAGMGMVVGDPEWFYQLVNDVDEETPDTKAGEKLEYVRLITKQSQVYGEVIREAAARVSQQASYPQTELAEQLKIVARLIAGGLKTRLYMVSIHGFDTHDSQVLQGDHTQGEHANLLRELGDAVEAFTKDLKQLSISDRVMGATISEFGRRIISNGSNGTDHGAAAPMFVFGEQVAGGIYGNNPVIPVNPEVNDNLAMEVDFRSVYATLLKNWFCTDESALQSSLPGNLDLLPIISSSACLSTSIQDRNKHAGSSYVDVYPNPVVDMARVEFTGSGEYLRIDLVSQSGVILKNVIQGRFSREKHVATVPVHDLPAGLYYVRYKDRHITQSKSIVKY